MLGTLPRRGTGPVLYRWTGRKWISYGSQITKFSGFAYALAVIPGTRSTLARRPDLLA